MNTIDTILIVAFVLAAVLWSVTVVFYTYIKTFAYGGRYHHRCTVHIRDWWRGKAKAAIVLLRRITNRPRGPDT